MKSLFLAAAILTASSAFAQSKPIKVQVSTEDDLITRDIADGLSAQIGSSLRYALVTEAGADTSILVSVNCLSVPANDPRAVIVCNVSMEYWPLETALSTELEGEMVSGSESQVIQKAFNFFVKYTTDEFLMAEAKRFKEHLNHAIRNYPNGVK